MTTLHTNQMITSCTLSIINYRLLRFTAQHMDERVLHRGSLFLSHFTYVTSPPLYDSQHQPDVERTEHEQLSVLNEFGSEGFFGQFSHVVKEYLKLQIGKVQIALRKEKRGR